MLSAEDRKLLLAVDRKLTKLLELKQAEEAEKWVEGETVRQRTGWTRNQLRNKREKGLVAFKKISARKYLYNLNSINYAKSNTGRRLFPTVANFPLPETA